MKLEEYLKVLNELPDESLHGELGVYDNFPILYKWDFKEMVKLFQDGNWKLRGIDVKKLSEELRERDYYLEEIAGRPQIRNFTFWFSFVQAHVVAQITDKAYTFFSYRNISDNEKFKRKVKRIGFNGTIMLHTHKNQVCTLPERTKLSEQLRDVSVAIEDISENAIMSRIPLCIYKIGDNYRESSSALNRVVFYNPK